MLLSHSMSDQSLQRPRMDTIVIKTRLMIRLKMILPTTFKYTLHTLTLSKTSILILSVIEKMRLLSHQVTSSLLTREFTILI